MYAQTVCVFYLHFLLSLSRQYARVEVLRFGPLLPFFVRQKECIEEVKFNLKWKRDSRIVHNGVCIDVALQNDNNFDA